MGRGYALVAKMRYVWVLTYFLLVLQEIQREDNLWHEKHKSAQQPGTTPKSEDKPAQESTAEETTPAPNTGETTKAKPTRKPTFF